MSSRSSDSPSVPDVFSSPSAGGASDDMTASSSPPPLVPPPPVPPFRCDDWTCCGTNPCNVVSLVRCQGIGISTPVAVNGNVHGLHLPYANVDTCGSCRQHMHHATNPQQITTNSDCSAAPYGFRSQLCHECIRDEVALYWERQGTARPTGSGAAPSLALVQRWPVAPGGQQDLCICMGCAVAPFTNHCHNCRNRAFINNATNAKVLTQRVLRDRTTAVITGRKLCDLNGPVGTPERLIPPNERARRGQIGRKCPCGRRPKRAEAPRTREYITVCLACMGVKIRPMNLPARYRQNMFQNRILHLRSGDRPAYTWTKGPMHARRDCRFRVNIERGWVDQDPFVGGTY
ncbi:hypothetical protein EJ07DRAFT_152554 [Lizonia empirigonia]|nr:hypothetical protein EJ07DRAFT_152554 [Lizonia empirigonia]